jgi:uncharacterized protein YigA (DUF484 family)
MTDSNASNPVTDISDTTQNQPSALAASDIIAYLQANPDFLKQNPQAIDLLRFPSASGTKNVADFQSYMIERLKTDKSQIERATQQLVENARSNMNNQQRIHAAILRLLEANSFDDFIHCITLDLASMLNVDIAVLIVEADGTSIPHIHNTGIRVVPEGTIDKWMQSEAVMLQDNISGIEAIYGGGATLVQSQILLRIDISMGTPPALLAFGSRDAGMFAPRQATDQSLFLARVIERAFRTWLQLPN